MCFKNTHSWCHVNAMAFQITENALVCSAANSGWEQRIYQSSASLDCSEGSLRVTDGFPHKRSVMQKAFPWASYQIRKLRDACAVMQRFLGHSQCDLSIIFTRDFVTRENYWQIASLVTQKSSFAVTHELFCMSALCHGHPCVVVPLMFEDIFDILGDPCCLFAHISYIFIYIHDWPVVPWKMRQ